MLTASSTSPNADLYYLLATTVATFGGIIVVWLKIKNIHKEVKSPNGVTTGNQLYTMRQEQIEIKEQILEIESNQRKMRDSLSDLKKTSEESSSRLNTLETTNRILSVEKLVAIYQAIALLQKQVAEMRENHDNH